MSKNELKKKDLEKESKRRAQENDDLVDRLSKIDINMKQLTEDISDYQMQNIEMPEVIEKTRNHLIIADQEKRKLLHDIHEIEKGVFGKQPR